MSSTNLASAGRMLRTHDLLGLPPPILIFNSFPVWFSYIRPLIHAGLTLSALPLVWGGPSFHSGYFPLQIGPMPQLFDLSFIPSLRSCISQSNVLPSGGVLVVSFLDGPFQFPPASLTVRWRPRLSSPELTIRPTTEVLAVDLP